MEPTKVMDKFLSTLSAPHHTLMSSTHESFTQGAPGFAKSTSLFARLISHQPAVLLSQNEPATSNQPQPASSTLLSEQTSTSHQPPANRTGSLSFRFVVVEKPDRLTEGRLFLVSVRGAVNRSFLLLD
jgi:hypothetical protein